jgi:hypothetical protein
VESIQRVRGHLAELGAMVADHRAENRRYCVAFDIGEPQGSPNGFSVSIRNAHKGPITAIEFASMEEAEAAADLLRSAIEPAVAVTDTKGKTW